MKKIILFLIKTYQRTLSRENGLAGKVFPGRSCRFFPTCSQYTYEAVEEFGIFSGGWMGIKRIARCHPWNEGGFDPVDRSGK
ncbi:MAG: membrane protein insertion efficiency factor YidD [Patescibacteria group bacterium]